MFDFARMTLKIIFASKVRLAQDEMIDRYVALVTMTSSHNFCCTHRQEFDGSK